MKTQAKYSVMCSIYFIPIFSIPTTKINTAAFLNDQPEIITNIESKEYTFKGDSWQNITMQDIDDIPADTESITFAFTPLKKIPEALFKKISNVKHITFVRNRRLKHLPQSFYKLNHVISLTIRLTFALNSLPSNFSSLEDLSIAVISIRDTNKILKSVKNFMNLKSLSLSLNTLHKLPYTLFDLKQLESIDVSNNLLSEVDKRMLNMPNLKHLDYAFNSLTSFTNIKVQLFKQLESINLSHNKFVSEFSGKKSGYDATEGSIYQPTTSNASDYKLKHFYIAENRFGLPKVLRWYSYIFQNLELLDIRDSKIRTLPDFIYDLHNLTYLDVRDNYLTDDIARLKDMHIENLLY